MVVSSQVLFVPYIQTLQICKKAKWLSEEALQIAKKRQEREMRNEKIYPYECRVPKNIKKR